MFALKYLGLIALALVTIVSGACHHGWTQYQSSCYLFIEDQLLNFTAAESFCTRLKGKLAEVESANENTFLRHYILHNTTASHNFWLGGSDAVVEGEWIWMTTMKQFKYTDWSSYSPDNFQSHQNCVMFFKPDSYHWNDDSCDDKAGFICEADDFCERCLPSWMDTVSEFLLSIDRKPTVGFYRGRDNFWLGGTDAVVEGEWIWMTTMEQFEYTDWSPYSPDNHQSHQDCVMFFPIRPIPLE